MTLNIALTGATGFVGGHLLKMLISQGHHVKALTRRPQKEIKNVIWVSGDFENCSALKELTENVDVIINVAGLVKARNRDEFLEANSSAISQLLNSIDQAAEKPHFMQISSLAAREPDISDYAYSKFCGEEALKNNSLGLNWTIIRPPGIYGPRDNETLKIFKMLKCRVAIFPGNKHNRVSWIHVTDLASAITHLIKREEYFKRTLEIDDGMEKGYSHDEFYQLIANSLNVTPLKITTPKAILKFIGHTNDILGRIFGYAPMVSSKKVNELCHKDWICRKNKEFQIQDWQSKIDLKTGLNETLNWYKNNEYM